MKVGVSSELHLPMLDIARDQPRVDAYRYPTVDGPTRNYTYIEAVDRYLGAGFAHWLKLRSLGPNPMPMRPAALLLLSRQLCPRRQAGRT